MRNKLSVSEILFLLYIGLIPLEDAIVFNFFGSITRFVGILLAIVFLIENRVRFKLISKYAYIFIIYLSLSFVWAVYPEPYQSFRILQLFFSMIIVVNLFENRPKLFMLTAKMYILSSLGLSILTILYFTKTFSRSDAFQGGGLAPFALILTVALVFQFILIKTEQKKTTQITKFIKLIIIFLAIIATGTRAAWIAIVTLFIIHLYLEKKNKKRIVLYLFISLLLGVSIYHITGFQKFIDTRIGSASESEGANRLLIWKVGLTMYKDKPVFGFGYRNFPKNFTMKYIGVTNLDFSVTRNYLSMGVNRGSHSDYMGILVELGIVGLVLFISWLYYLFRPIDSFLLFKYLFIALLIMSFFQDNINSKTFWLVMGITESLKSPNFMNYFKSVL